MLTVSVCSKSCALAFSISSDTASSLDGARRYDSKRTIKTARDQLLKGRLNRGARPDDVTYSNNFYYFPDTVWTHAMPVLLAIDVGGQYKWFKKTIILF